MAELMEARVPDIGDDKDVPVIELLVKPGDTVKKDQGLVTLESDKATMEVPASPWSRATVSPTATRSSITGTSLSSPMSGTRSSILAMVLSVHQGPRQRA